MSIFEYLLAMYIKHKGSGVFSFQILYATELSNLVFYNCGFQHLRHSRTSAHHWGLNTSSLFFYTLNSSLLISLPTSKLMNVLSILNLKRAIQVNQSYYLSLMSSCCMCYMHTYPFWYVWTILYKRWYTKIMSFK